MISAREARQQTIEAINESDETQKNKIEKAITEAIAAKKFNCTLDFIPNTTIRNWLRSLGYSFTISSDSSSKNNSYVTW